jgi:hypothetical protein
MPAGKFTAGGQSNLIGPVRIANAPHLVLNLWTGSQVARPIG